MEPERPCILVVDDEPDERALLVTVLAQAGYLVRSADGAVNALTSIAELVPDLIMLDLSMPGMSGLAVLRELRAIADTAEVPVIVVSGQHDVEVRVASLADGANDYVAKPVSVPELLVRVRNALRAARELTGLRRGSFLDPLTGLLNRAGLDHLLGHQVQLAVRQHSALAVLFLDLDGFKAVNDEHGHAVGDRVIRDVAAALGRQLRAADFAARWGGDEFVVVLPATDPQLVPGVVTRLETAVRPTIGVSIGVASLFEDVPDGEDLAHRLVVFADAAMYRVKQRRGVRAHAPAAPPSSTPARARAR